MAVSKQYSELVHSEDKYYELACRFIRKEYLQHFDCDLKHFMPHIFVLKDGQKIKAAAGYRVASEGPLFLEQYLDLPIEDMVCSAMQKQCHRQKIVEVGGFAAVDRQSALTLMSHLAAWFYECDYQILVCAANKPIQRCLKHTGLSWVVLGQADAGRVDQAANAWGNYYRSQPSVLAGDIRKGAELFGSLEKTPAGQLELA